MAQLDGLAGFGTPYKLTNQNYSVSDAVVNNRATLRVGRNGTQTVTIPNSTKLTTGARLLVIGDDLDMSGSNSVTVTDGVMSELVTYYGQILELIWTGTAWERGGDSGGGVTAASAGATPRFPKFPDQGTTITAFQSGHGWISAYGGAGTVDLNTTDDPYIGTQCVKVITDGAGTTHGVKKWAAGPYDMRGKRLRIAVKIQGVANLATDGFYVYAGTSSLANYRVFVVLPQTGQNWLVDDEWCEFSIPWNTSAARSSSSGTLDRSAVTDINIRFKDDASGNPVTAYIGRVSLVPETEATRATGGLVTFTFDDGYESVFTQAAPVLTGYGWPATHYTICELVGESGRVTADQLRRLQGIGWDVALHCYAASTHAATFAGLSTEALETDLAAGVKWLRDNGFRGADHGSYPLGKFTGGTADILGIVRKRFAAYRSIYSQVGATIPSDDPHRQRITINLAYPLTLASAKALLDAAMAAGEWVVVLAHNLVASPSVSTEWAISDFSDFCAYVASHYPGAAVKTVADAMGLRDAPEAPARTAVSQYSATSDGPVPAGGVTWSVNLKAGRRYLVTVSLFAICPSPASDAPAAIALAPTKATVAGATIASGSIPAITTAAGAASTSTATLHAVMTAADDYDGFVLTGMSTSWILVNSTGSRQITVVEL